MFSQAVPTKPDLSKLDRRYFPDFVTFCKEVHVYYGFEGSQLSRYIAAKWRLKQNHEVQFFILTLVRFGKTKNSFGEFCNLITKHSVKVEESFI